MVKNRSEKVVDQFKAMSEALNKALEAKEEALLKMYRKDPRISRDDAVSTLNKMIEDFKATCISLQTMQCENFSDDNENVNVSSCKRSVQYIGHDRGYCFLNHQKTGNDTLLKWTLRVPRFELNYFEFNSFIGKVTNVILQIFLKGSAEFLSEINFGKNGSELVSSDDLD